MGLRFDLKYANLVAYVTAPPTEKPPRLTVRQVREFLGSIQGEDRDKPPLISTNPVWIRTVAGAANKAARTLASRYLQNDSLLDGPTLEDVLGELRLHLSRYDLFGLTVGTRVDRDPLNAFAEHAAYSSKHHALFLIPDLPDSGDTLEIFDPLPAARKIAARPDLWPGVLFWTRIGSAVFVSLDEAALLYSRILQSFWRGIEGVSAIIEEFARSSPEPQAKRVLQLSDLHFGSEKALENQGYLAAHLKSKTKSIHRVVVTGDLFDNPDRTDYLAFRNFRSDLETSTGHDVIVIPGNHDEKIRGNAFRGVGKRLDEVANLEWSSLVIDDAMQCVFYCLDSSKDAPDFARGKITRQQMMEIATLFETKAAAKPAIRDYLSVALIHHHPYSFKAGTETPIQKTLAAVALEEERFLRMDDANNFLSWCVGRRIPLILHGHKHVPRHVTDTIEWKHGKESVWRDVTAVGCGTSLGIEGLPLSYNILEWSPSTRKWTASFFADPGFGTGFEEQYVAVHAVRAAA